jgi:hypothetical protein
MVDGEPEHAAGAEAAVACAAATAAPSPAPAPAMLPGSEWCATWAATSYQAMPCRCSPDAMCRFPSRTCASACSAAAARISQCTARPRCVASGTCAGSSASKPPAAPSVAAGAPPADADVSGSGGSPCTRRTLFCFATLRMARISAITALASAARCSGSATTAPPSGPTPPLSPSDTPACCAAAASPMKVSARLKKYPSQYCASRSPADAAACSRRTACRASLSQAEMPKRCQRPTRASAAGRPCSAARFVSATAASITASSSACSSRTRDARAYSASDGETGAEWTAPDSERKGFSEGKANLPVARAVTSRSAHAGEAGTCNAVLNAVRTGRLRAKRCISTTRSDLCTATTAGSAPSAEDAQAATGTQVIEPNFSGVLVRACRLESGVPQGGSQTAYEVRAPARALNSLSAAPYANRRKVSLELCKSTV